MRQWLPILALASLVACSSPNNPDDDDDDGGGNRAPVVSSVTATPTFGVQDFGIFTFNASATDADGDALTFTWNIGGIARTGASAQAGPFTNGGTANATVTVTDTKGGSATGSVNFVVGTMTGNWAGGIPGTAVPSFTMALAQTLGTFGGSITIPGLAPGQVGPTGAIATLSATGLVVMRIKVAPFQDFTMTGQMDGTGRIVTGTVQGSGFVGQAFTMTKS
jgi:hypothetical protein